MKSANHYIILVNTMKKPIKNISIFIFVSLSSGWIGLLINKLINAGAVEESPGMLIWLVLPLITVLALRAFTEDGWKDLGVKPNFK